MYQRNGGTNTCCLYMHCARRSTEYAYDAFNYSTRCSVIRRGQRDFFNTRKTLNLNLKTICQIIFVCLSAKKIYYTCFCQQRKNSPPPSRFPATPLKCLHLCLCCAYSNAVVTNAPSTRHYCRVAYVVYYVHEYVRYEVRPSRLFAPFVRIFSKNKSPPPTHPLKIYQSTT